MAKKTRTDKKSAERKTKRAVEAAPLGEIQAAAPAAGWSRHAPVIALALVLVFLATVRLRVADVPIERDEGEYAYSGQLILQGFPPYQLAYNMKFPGTYYAYAVILALFGQTAWGVHAGLLAVNALTVVLVFLLARRLLRDSMAAAVAASAYGFLSLDRWILGVFGHATHFVVLAAVAGLLLLLRAIETKKSAAFLGAGALLGVSVLMKQNGIFFFAAGLAIAAWSALRKPERDWRAAALRASLVATGGALVFGILCLTLAAQGAFGKFWFWTFQYAREYVSEVSIADAWTLFSSTVLDITQANKPIWIAAGAGVVLLWLVRWASETRTVLSILLAASLLAICPGFYFRQHYFLLLLPAAALFCGVAVLSLQRALSALMPGTAARVLAAAAFALTLCAYVAHEQQYLFAMAPQDLSRLRYGANPFVEAPEIARYIQAHTNASDRIAVFGSEPEIYFLANRKSATGHIYTYGLMEHQAYSQRMQEEMMAEVTAAHPKYVVYVLVPMSWLARSSDEKILKWNTAYLQQCYDLVGLAEILPGRPTQYLWEDATAGYQPKTQNLLGTYKAKSDAPCAVKP